MTNLKFLQKFFFFLLIGFSLCIMHACDDDNKIIENPDNNPEIKNELVGTWKYYFSSGYKVKCFNSDGTGYEQEYDEADGGWHSKDEFNYTYYKESGKLIITDKEENKTSIYKVISLTSEILELENPDGDLDTYYRVEEEIVEPDNPALVKEKKLVKILKEKSKRYDENSPLKMYSYIYEFDYNDDGFLSSARFYDDEGYTESINYEYSDNKIFNDEITYSLFNGKVSVYDGDDYYNYYKLGYASSNKDQLNKIGENSEYIVTWDDDKITKFGKTDFYYDLPFQSYYWYNIYTYDGKSCNGFIDLGILGFSNIFNLDDGKTMSDVIMLVHPELFGLKTNQLPKSSKEDVYVSDYNEETGEESIYDGFVSYAYTYEFDSDGYIKKVTKINVDANDEYITHTYTWEDAE